MRRTTAFLLLIGLLAAGACYRQNPSSGAGSKASTTTATETKLRPGELAFLLPTWTPEGLSFGEPTVRRDRAHGAGFVAVLGRPGDGGAFTDVIRVIVSPAEADREVSDDERKRIEPVRVGSVTARRSIDAFTGASVDWFQAGRSVLVIGPADNGDVVVDVARRVRLDGTTAADTRLEGVPDGYQEIGIGRTTGFPGQEAELSATDPRGTSFRLAVQVLPAGSLPLATFTVGTELRTIEIRGKEAVVATNVSRMRNLEITSRSIAWFEAEGVMVSASGTQMAEADLVKLLESLKPVTEEEFLAAGDDR